MTVRCFDAVCEIDFLDYLWCWWPWLARPISCGRYVWIAGRDDKGCRGAAAQL